MKQGMNASATIVIEEKENIVTIPVNALQERGDEVFVYTQKGEDGILTGEQKVSTGLSDGRNFAFNNRILRFAGCTLGKTEGSVF